ncbi:type I-B CRISPR-associated protein Cas5b [Methanolacinia paynteri]|uniref:type I-B CRISPR-associated protein Cas5b n=1 Tax=Methanolacinia paynteri TaxID=230356 RepID=UPI000A9A67D5|nr:type I-B CRISPR-associated protein Cas5b [Methanolacinia paynteri]
MDKILAFDIWGDYGHFRKIYTTTSPLTYSVPTRTSLTGVIGAIAGLDKESYLSVSSKEDEKIAVGLNNAVKKVRLAENLIKTAGGFGDMNEIKARTQIRFELLKDPSFRVYFTHSDDELYTKVKSLLSDHKCVYTPCLGLSEFIANFSYIGEFEYEPVRSGDIAEIRTVIPESKVKMVDFQDDLEYISEKQPLEMDEERCVTEYDNVIFERRAQPVSASVTEFCRLSSGDNIVFL